MLKIQNLERYKTAYENKIKREMGDKTGKYEDMESQYDELQLTNIKLHA